MFADINRLARDTGWLHGPLLAYASWGAVLFGALLVIGWWTARPEGGRRMAAALWAGAGTLIAVAANQPLVNSVREARPYTDHPAILVLASRSSDYSFPSDHAVMAGAVAAGLWLVNRRLATVATVAALLMAFTRVYVAAHYPHDVLAGLLLGAAIVVVGWWLLARPLTRLVDRLAATPLRPLFSCSSFGSAGAPPAGATAPRRPAAGNRRARARRRTRPSSGPGSA
jgi:undecaprenyl-diphosphatase